MRKFFSIDNVQFRVSLLVLAIIALIILAFYLHCKEPQLTPSETAKIVTGGLVIIGLMYSILTYESNQKKNRHDIRIQKCSTTYKAIGEWHTSPMIDYSKCCIAFAQEKDYILLKTDVKAFVIAFDKPKNIEFRKSLICIFNYFESMSVAVNEDIMDEAFMKKYFRNIFYAFYDDYINFIKERRENKKNEEIWIEFTTLVEKWKFRN